MKKACGLRKCSLLLLLVILCGLFLYGCGTKKGQETQALEGNTDETMTADDVEEQKTTTEPTAVPTAEPTEVAASDVPTTSEEERNPVEEVLVEGDEMPEQETEEPEVTRVPGITPSVTGGTPYEQHGTLSVTGTMITGQNGEVVVLKGVSTHGLSWFPQYANYDAFRTMRDEWGINTVRLAMYTAEYNGYCTGDENNRNQLKQLIYDSVDAATELGLYVIVDWHVLQDQNPNTYKDQAIAFFSEVSNKLKNQSNVIYEICNEPNGGVSWQQIKSYAEEVIPVIRANDPDAIIIVGTPTWSQDVDQAAANPITGYDNIMYALHFYADTHRESLRNRMVSAIQSGLPIFVSEYGICDASGSGAINSGQATLWMETMQQYNVSFCAWNLSNKGETSAMIRTDCNKTSDWTYDELSASGQWYVDWMREHADAEPAPLGQSGGNNASGSNDNSQNGNSGQNNQSQENNSAQNSQGNNVQGNTQSAAALSATATNGTLTVTVNVTNRWESEGQYFYQCDVRFNNQGSQKVNGWEFELSGNASLELSQGWCGIFSVNGGKIKATPESYNAVIEAGSERGDIGIIICSDQPITQLQVSVTAK